MKHVYHFTDSARLSWILHDGELKPGRARVGGFPDPDFLWATTNSRGDRTASGGLGGYKEGAVRLVRITLHQDDFVPWPDAAADHDEWTPALITKLEAAAAVLGTTRTDIAGWWCRSSSVPLARFVAVDTRTWRNNIWKPFGADPASVIYAKQGEKVAAGIEVDGMGYFSERVEHADGRRGYSIFRSDGLVGAPVAQPYLTAGS